METKVIEMTPQLAQQYLERNTRNRNISRLKVKQILDDIEHDRWDLHHQGIGFYEDGALADGQTRLTAIAESGKTVEIMVTWGLPSKSAASIDRHRPRSDADSIRISGLSNWIGKDEISLVKMIALAHQKGTPTYSAQHLADLGEFLKEPIEFAMRAFPSSKKFITISPVMAAVAIASLHVDHDRLMEFAEVLVSGIPQTLDDVAAIRLRESLRGDHDDDKAKKVIAGQTARREVLLKTMRAIKAFVLREHLQKLYVPSEMIYRVPGIEVHL